MSYSIEDAERERIVCEEINNYFGKKILHRREFINPKDDEQNGDYDTNPSRNFYDLKCCENGINIFITDGSIDNFGPERSNGRGYFYIICKVDPLTAERSTLLDNCVVVENTSMRSSRRKGTLDGMESTGRESGDAGVRISVDYFNRKWDVILPLKKHLDILNKNLKNVEE